MGGCERTMPLSGLWFKRSALSRLNVRQWGVKSSAFPKPCVLCVQVCRAELLILWFCDFPRLTVVACGGWLVVHAAPFWCDMPAPRGTSANLSRAWGSQITFGGTLMEREAMSVQAAVSSSLEAALSRALGCPVHPAAYLLAYLTADLKWLKQALISGWDRRVLVGTMSRKAFISHFIKPNPQELLRP